MVPPGIQFDPRLMRLIRSGTVAPLPPMPPNPMPKQWVPGPVRAFNQQRFNQDMLNQMLNGKPLMPNFLRQMFGRRR